MPRDLFHRSLVGPSEWPYYPFLTWNTVVCITPNPPCTLSLSLQPRQTPCHSLKWESGSYRRIARGRTPPGRVVTRMTKNYISYPHLVTPSPWTCSVPPLYITSPIYLRLSILPRWKGVLVLQSNLQRQARTSLCLHAKDADFICPRPPDLNRDCLG